MGKFFNRPHPWIMQALGGLLALIIMIPIATYVVIAIIINGKAPEAAPTYAVPQATTAASAPPASTPLSTGGSGKPVAGAIAHPAWADVHKIFAANCQPCHITAATAGLNLNTYASALKGGSKAAGGVVNGPVIKPGDPLGSYLYLVATWQPALYHKMDGGAGQNMPLGASHPISAADQQTIYNWIKQGAKS